MKKKKKATTDLRHLQLLIPSRDQLAWFGSRLQLSKNVWLSRTAWSVRSIERKSFKNLERNAECIGFIMTCAFLKFF